jgi:hypothetical protein
VDIATLYISCLLAASSIMLLSCEDKHNKHNKPVSVFDWEFTSHLWRLRTNKGTKADSNRRTSPTGDRA